MQVNKNNNTPCSLKSQCRRNQTKPKREHGRSAKKITIKKKESKQKEAKIKNVACKRTPSPGKDIEEQIKKQNDKLKQKKKTKDNQIIRVGHEKQPPLQATRERQSSHKQRKKANRNRTTKTGQ